MSQHGALTVERWARFSLDQQILMIANEMNRVSKLLGSAHREHRRNAYERILALTDLTVQARPEPGFRRELLRWRDLIAALYASPDRDEKEAAAEHAAAFRVLLRFTPEASRQIPHVLGKESRS